MRSRARRMPALRSGSFSWGPAAAWLTLVCAPAMLGLGCAPAAPTLLGEGTTPVGRVDVALGGAARVPLEGLAPVTRPEGTEELAAFAVPGGLAPVGFVRWGAARHAHVGLAVSAESLRVDVVLEAALSPTLRLQGGLMPYGGYTGSSGRDGHGAGDGFRAGVLAPLAVGIDIGGVFGAWAGVRGGVEHVEGSVGPVDARQGGHLDGARAGGFVGLSAGFRRVHGMVELSADHEWWQGALGGAAVTRQGFALTPAFGLRIRF